MAWTGQKEQQQQQGPGCFSAAAEGLRIVSVDGCLLTTVDRAAEFETVGGHWQGEDSGCVLVKVLSNPFAFSSQRPGNTSDDSLLLAKTWSIAVRRTADSWDSVAGSWWSVEFSWSFLAPMTDACLPASYSHKWLQEANFPVSIELLAVSELNHMYSFAVTFTMAYTVRLLPWEV